MFNRRMQFAHFFRRAVGRVSRICDLASKGEVKLRTLKILFVLILTTVGTLTACLGSSQNLFAKHVPESPPDSQSELLRSFAELDPIDSHTHVYDDNFTFNALLKGLNLHILSIAVIDDRYQRSPTYSIYFRLKPQLHDMLGLEPVMKFG